MDSNGVGYINKWTFDKTYTRPIVEEIGGRNLDDILVGYNPSTFFSNGTSCCVEGKEVKFLSFEIKSENTDDTNLYIPNHFPETVNKKFAIFSKPKGSNKMETIILE
ncbi:MAG: hypothetical protein EOO45_17815 [Flavobacterium sp.]|nr:MAG: hypothetical protein EOO45_17815 [Flavobacterium sp.]